MLQHLGNLRPLRRANLFEARPHLRPQPRTVTDIANVPRTASVVTNRLLFAIDLPRRPHAISPRVMRSHHKKLRNILEPRDAMQTVANDLSFRGKLSFVSQLLKVTTTATAEVRTRRFHSHGRRR